MLEFKNVSFKRDGKPILLDISLKINVDDYILVVGPSGSGKSTFLKLCCHLVSPDEGSITIKGKDIFLYEPVELRRSISYCFQNPYLFGDTVEDNIAFPYSIRNQKVDYARVDELFSQFKLSSDFLKKNVKILSGGEKQRISLIRTLLFKPDILLLDEVTSALDIDNTLIVEKVINDLNKEGIPVLWISHDIEQQKRHRGKLLAFENGRIVKFTGNQSFFGCGRQ